MSEKNTSAGKYAKFRFLRKIGIIAVGVSAPLITLFVVVSLLPRTNYNSFTIKLDQPGSMPNIVMKNDLKTDVTTNIISGTPLEKGWTVTTLDVMNYIDSFSIEDIGGNHNYIRRDEGESEDYGRAIVQTVFLQNVGNVIEDFKYTVSLDNFTFIGENSTSPYEYMRIATITSDVEEITDSPSNGKVARFYAAQYVGSYRGAAQSKLHYDSEDEGYEYNATIAKYAFVANPNEDGRTDELRRPIDSYEGQKYCKNFLDRNDGVIVEDSISVAPGKTLRFTFAAYLEGEDDECSKRVPQSTSMLMSLHFGR